MKKSLFVTDSMSAPTVVDPDRVAPERETSEVLGKMLADFGDFEGQLRNGTRQRREKDEHRVAELRATLKRNVLRTHAPPP